MGEISTHIPTNFIVDPQKNAANAHSGHNVTFGKLESCHLDVAIKPFTVSDGKTLETRRSMAEHELRMYQLIQKLGFQTLKPITVMDENDVAYLVSEYTPDLVPGTSFDLTGPVDQNKKGKTPAQVSSEILGLLGLLHNKGITHGDAKLRNYVYHRLTGKGPYVVDLEGAQKHESAHPGGVEFFENAVRNDLGSLTRNIGQNGFGACYKDTDLENIFYDLLYTPYAKQREGQGSIPGSTTEAAVRAYKIGVNEYNGVGYRYV